MAAPCSAVNHLRWDLSAQQIAELTTELIEQTKRVYDRVGAQEPQDVSYENTLKALADVEVSYTGEPCPDLAMPPPSQGPSGEALAGKGPWWALVSGRQPGLAGLHHPPGPCHQTSSPVSLETGAPGVVCFLRAAELGPLWFSAPCHLLVL